MIRTGIGFDAHRFAHNRRLVLGGVEIRDHNGLEGHSDADVLCHAVMDAMLGAIAEGDIGKHFPDTDPKWKDADSLKMLRQVVALINAKGFHVVNVDSTVIAQSPKIAPYVDNMRCNMAEVIGVAADRVSVKATTMEKMGALGREEGIAVLAVVTVEHI
ncbi:MAG: 2-C-methyl-D-erythritol 2,4-cyclodiphosphate synthase [Kiritimatiellae bacterium]|nr:2-C-methyl-D-erythritol 2,4-cyclodiphosphate synthase [Kiritimatiellia bacterium]MDD5520385.1 2-C-methyl-D-erythritol 2,4-cyclodiphosphate synthase [Kiritimatiellia bacterium]